MSWREIFNALNPARNQNNIIPFPGKENKEFKKQKDEMAILIMTMDQIMNTPGWETTPIPAKYIEQLSNFGETISFSPLTSQRLIACLCTELLKYRLNDLEDYL